MPDAISQFIADLEAGTYSQFPQNLIAPVADAIAALQEIQAAIAAIPPSAGANLVYAGPSGGGPGAPSFRALVGADLPAPTAGSLGGVEAIAPVANNYLTGISAAGVPQLGRPVAANLSDWTNCAAWVPVDASGAGLAFAIADATYSKLGNTFWCGATLTYPATASGANAAIGGLPFNWANRGGVGGLWAAYISSSPFAALVSVANTPTMDFLTATGAAITNATLSTQVIRFQGIGFAA